MTTVLIADGDRSTREALRAVLRRLGYEVTAVATASAAIRKIESCSHAIVDADLPDLPGLEVVKHVRDRKLPVRVAIVAPGNNPELLKDIKGYGTDALFIRPLKLESILAWLDAGAAEADD